MPARLTLLGGAHVAVGDESSRRDPTPVPADRRGWLLALVAVRGDWVSRDLLATRFWPDDDETNAKRNLRQLLRRLKQHPVAAALEIDAQRVRWAGACDVHEFRAAVAAGDPTAALHGYAGPLLAGFPPITLDEVAAELDAEREGLHEAFRTAASQVAAGALADGRPDEAAALLRRVVEDEPLAEDVLQRYLEALLASGRRDAAQDAYERFARRLREELDLTPLDATRALLERTEPVHPLPTVPRAALPRPADTVGRDGELRALRASVAPMVLLIGEAGIGKSHLLRVAWPDALRTGASEALHDVPFHPLTALVRDPRFEARGLGPRRDDLARLVPDLAPGPAAPLPPDLARARALDALVEAWRQQTRPIVVDDLHWADAATLEALALVAERGGRVWAAARSEEPAPRLDRWRSALRARGLLQEIAVGPLDEGAMTELARTALDDPAMDGTAARAWGRYLRWRTGGHPLFALATLHAARDAGAPTPPATSPTPGGPAARGLPSAVREGLDRRLARLDPVTLRVLEAEAVVASGLDVPFLAQVTGLSRDAVEDALDDGERAGVLAPAEAEAERPHGFAHDLWRDVLASRPTASRRRSLHARAAEALTRAAGRGPSDDGAIAQHWVAAGQPERAAAAYARQVAALRARSLHEDAVSVAEAALALGSDHAAFGRLRLLLAELLRELDRPAAAETALARLEANPPEDARLRFDVAIARTALELHHGRLDRAEHALRVADVLVASLADPDLTLEHTMMRARWLQQAARSAEAHELLVPALEQVRDRPPDARRVRFVSAAAAILDDIGRPEEALPLHREALDHARALGARYQAVDAMTNLLFCLSELGRQDEGIALATAALEEASASFDNVPILRNNVAALCFEAGRWREALRHYTPLMALEEQPYLRTIALARCADAHARLGETAPVAALLDTAIDSLTATDYPVAHACAATVVLRLGSDAQVARLQAVSQLDPNRAPPHQRAELEAAMVARGLAVVRPGEAS